MCQKKKKGKEKGVRSKKKKKKKGKEKGEDLATTQRKQRKGRSVWRMGVRQPFAIFAALRDEKKEALPYPSPQRKGIAIP